MKLFGTMKIDESGTLTIGGCSTVALAKEMGTPLYVFDEAHLRENCRRFLLGFKKEGVATEVIYASKAFLNIAMCRLIAEEGLSLDVVSGGELYTAQRAGFPMERIYFHGNNKSEEELRMALSYGIGRIVVDHQGEIATLERLCNEMNKEICVLLRVNPGIEAHTHQYIQTANHDSKFGESILGEAIGKIVEFCEKSKFIKLKGFHCHIGSQIFEEKSFYSAIEVMIGFVKKARSIWSFETEELNLGGGFGVYYSEGDTPVDLDRCLQNMLTLLENAVKKEDLKMPKVMIEPGRSIVANGGCTLYTVGGGKETYGGKKFVFVDGGMTDNPRTALYGAKYEAAIANKMREEIKERVTIAGKCCESGDIVIHDIDLPKAEVGDVLCVFSTGAYNYTMASNYNRLPRPAVVFVGNGESRVVVKRETYEDLLKNDMIE